MTDEELIARLRDAPADGLGTENLCIAASDRIEALVKENAEFQQTFDMQWKADMRAIKMWQEAHPGNELVWPDGAKLTVWLMERVEALVKERDKFLADFNESSTSLMEALIRIQRLEAALQKLACNCPSNCDWEHGDICPSWIARAALKGDDHD